MKCERQYDDLTYRITVPVAFRSVKYKFLFAYNNYANETNRSLGIKIL